MFLYRDVINTNPKEITTIQNLYAEIAGIITICNCISTARSTRMTAIAFKMDLVLLLIIDGLV